MFFGFCYEERSVVLRDLKRGQVYQVELRAWDSAHLHSLPVKMPAGFSIGVIPELDSQEAIDQAVELAKDSDECVVVVGLNKEFETEGDDRSTMRWVQLSCTESDRAHSPIIVYQAPPMSLWRLCWRSDQTRSSLHSREWLWRCLGS